MKCPKCSYLGFETGDRCKNCGYDFSLLVAPSSPRVDADITMRLANDMPSSIDESWMDRLRSHEDKLVEAHELADPMLTDTPTVIDMVPPAAPAQVETSFPLFAPTREDDDEPLIKMPAAPRAPLSVRRTPEQPRLRPSSKPGGLDGPGLSLEFAEDSFTPAPIGRAPVEPRIDRAARTEVCSIGRRAVAGLTDHVILFGIDLVVVYSTLRIAALTMGDWPLLPLAPMLVFLVLLKLAYFGAFTAACGQTIGKMAVHIRVIGDDERLDPARAVRRTLMAAVSLITFGAGFIPAFLDPERRALHDRVARTRVVELPSA